MPYQNLKQISESTRLFNVGREPGANPIVRFGDKAFYPLGGLILKTTPAIVNKKFVPGSAASVAEQEASAFRQAMP